ncbi:MAG TPA: hypothetical protein VMX75_03010, partial [Spirochaetia bacterium]|nr:hypothetical protein [Spirochaetia bacterium]
MLEVSAALDPAPYREVLTSLSDGLEAEIQFQFRIYEKVDDLFSIFGDRLLIERHPTYRARMDFFENAYVITSSDGTTHETNGQASFIENFFQIDSYPLESFEPERGKRYYLRA